MDREREEKKSWSYSLDSSRRAPFLPASPDESLEQGPGISPDFYPRFRKSFAYFFLANPLCTRRLFPCLGQRPLLGQSPRDDNARDEAGDGEDQGRLWKLVCQGVK